MVESTDPPTTSTDRCSSFDPQEEVNRKVLEILRRMTSENPSDSSTKPVSKTPTTTSRQTRSATKACIPATPSPLIPETKPKAPLPNAKPPQSPSSTRRCSCSRSGCLKLYCECFASGAFCGDCSCVGCFNLLWFEPHRQKAIERIVTRKPDAFQSKIGHLGQDAPVHVRGCNCRRSGCLKNYCECFEAGIRCTSRCRCKYCSNTNPDGATCSGQPAGDESSEANVDEKISSHSSAGSSSPVGSGWPKMDSINGLEASSVAVKQEGDFSSPTPSCPAPSQPPQFTTPTEVKKIVSVEQFQLLYPKSPILRPLLSVQSTKPIMIHTTTVPISTFSSQPRVIATSGVKLVSEAGSFPCILTSLPKVNVLGSATASSSPSDLLNTWLALVSNGSLSVNSTNVTLQNLAQSTTTTSAVTAAATSTLNTPTLSAKPAPLSSVVTNDQSPTVVHPLSPSTEYSEASEVQYTAEELATFEHLLRQRRTTVDQTESHKDLPMGVDSRDSCNNTEYEQNFNEHSTNSHRNPEIACPSKRFSRTKSDTRRSLHRRVDHLAHQIGALQRLVLKQHRLIRALLHRREPNPQCK